MRKWTTSLARRCGSWRISVAVAVAAGAVVLLTASPGTSGGPSQACANRAIGSASSYTRCVASQQRAGQSGAACRSRPVICVDWKKYRRWSKKRDLKIW
jgi:hypothetical protein